MKKERKEYLNIKIKVRTKLLHQKLRRKNNKITRETKYFANMKKQKKDLTKTILIIYANEMEKTNKT